MSWKSNIEPDATKVPVWKFLGYWKTLELKIGGLLDYGYDETQIAKELSLPLEQVLNIVQEQGYETIDKLMVQL